MRVLVVTNLFPSATAPATGIFVAQQVGELRAAGVDVELLHVDRGSLGRRAYFAAGSAVREAASRSRSELVHVRYGGVLADAVTRAVRDLPVLVTFCGNDLLGPGSVSSPLERLMGAYSIRASQRAARRALGIVAVSGELAAAVPADVDRSRIWVIPDGVDVERFAPRDRRSSQLELGWDPARRHVLFPAARNRPEKRFGLAEAAVELLRGRGRAIELHELDGVDHEDVPVWMNASDALTLVSVHEGSPNAVKEALACNVNVVGVRVGDVPELIDGIGGCVVAEPRPEAIAEALERCFDFGRPTDGRERAATVSLERVGAALRSVYATLVR